MRLTTHPALLTLSLLPPLISAVSLSDMKPRAENLPPDCNKIYTSQISGCGIPDFTTQSCTSTCIASLQAMVGPINEACGGQGVTGQNLVVAYLNDVGPQQICPNAPSGGGSSSSAVESATSATSATSVVSTATPTSVESSESVQSTSLLVDTSSAADSSATMRTRTPAFSGTTTATSLTREQTSASSTNDGDQSSTTTSNAAGAIATDDSSSSEAQTGGNSSGGGSPFDDEGNMFSGADSLSSTSLLVSLGIAVVVAVFLFS